MSSQQIISQDATPASKPIFFPVGKGDLLVAWPAVSEFLRGRKGSFMDKWDEPAFVNEIYANNDMHLWVAHDHGSIEGVMLVHFVRTPKEVILWITGVYCDNLRKYLPQIKNVEQWATMLGAEAILWDGSHAWKKLMKRFGYATPTALIRKSLTNMWSN